MSHYFCPQCQGPEVEVERLSLVVDIDKGPKARCPLCHWEGHRSDLLTTVLADDVAIQPRIWNGDQVANAMLYVASRYAAGPILQVLAQIGLVPPLKGLEQEYASAQNIREIVVKAVIEAVVTSAFETAGKLSPEHYKRFAPERAEDIERIFSYGGSDGKSG